MIILIAAIAENRCIGINGKLPWHLPDDLARFKALTIGKVVLMGRKTWESIPEKYQPLPGRTNVVVTRQLTYTVPPHVEVHASVDAALAAHAHEDLCVIGGAEVYAETIDRADILHLTLVHRTIDGDVFFPTIDTHAWQETEREPHAACTFVTYERVRILA